MAINGIFLAVGVSPIDVASGDGDYAFTISGPFSGTVWIEKSRDNFAWVRPNGVALVAGTEVDQTINIRLRQFELIRLNCTIYTSGTLNYSGAMILAASPMTMAQLTGWLQGLPTAPSVIPQWWNNGGSPVFS